MPDSDLRTNCWTFEESFALPGNIDWCVAGGEGCRRRNQYYGLIDLPPRRARIASVNKMPARGKLFGNKNTGIKIEVNGIRMRQLEKVLWAAKARIIGGSSGIGDGRPDDLRGPSKLSGPGLQ